MCVNVTFALKLALKTDARSLIHGDTLETRGADRVVRAKGRAHPNVVVHIVSDADPRKALVRRIDTVALTRFTDRHTDIEQLCLTLDVELFGTTGISSGAVSRGQASEGALPLDLVVGSSVDADTVETAVVGQGIARRAGVISETQTDELVPAVLVGNDVELADAEGQRRLRALSPGGTGLGAVTHRRHRRRVTDAQRAVAI